MFCLIEKTDPSSCQTWSFYTNINRKITMWTVICCPVSCSECFRLSNCRWNGLVHNMRNTRSLIVGHCIFYICCTWNSFLSNAQTTRCTVEALLSVVLDTRLLTIHIQHVAQLKHYLLLSTLIYVQRKYNKLPISWHSVC